MGEALAPEENRSAERLRMSVLGVTIRSERQARQMSLEAMASRSGVSRSMLSAIERGNKVPTVLVLDRIAGALGVNLARLLDSQRDAKVIHLPVSRQRVVSEKGGWQRNIVSPVIPDVELELGRLKFEPHSDPGEFGAHPAGSREYLVVEKGTLEVTLQGREPILLQGGDALYYESDLTHAFRNPSAKPTIAYILILHPPGRD